MALGATAASAFGLKTISAQHRTPLRGKKRDGGFGSALGADGARLRTRTWLPRSSFRLAWLAPLGIIAELLLAEEELLAHGENELTPTVNAFQNFVDQIHAIVPRVCPPGRENRVTCRSRDKNLRFD